MFYYDVSNYLMTKCYSVNFVGLQVSMNTCIPFIIYMMCLYLRVYTLYDGLNIENAHWYFTIYFDLHTNFIAFVMVAGACNCVIWWFTDLTEKCLNLKNDVAASKQVPVFNMMHGHKHRIQESDGSDGVVGRPESDLQESSDSNSTYTDYTKYFTNFRHWNLARSRVFDYDLTQIWLELYQISYFSTSVGDMNG